MSEKRIAEYRRQTQEINELAFGNWIQILMSIFPDITKAGEGFSDTRRPACACPFHASKTNKSFRFLKRANDTGACGCFTCGVWKDGYFLIMGILGISFKEARNIVAKEIGYNIVSEKDKLFFQQKAEIARQKRAILDAERKEKDLITKAKMLSRLKEIWKASISLDHPSSAPARLYFEKRGLPDVGALRGEVMFHQGLEYYIEDSLTGEYTLAGKFFCILSQIRTAKGYPIRLHRTYITKDGLKLVLSDNNPKKMTPAIPQTSITGGAIHLTPAGTKVLGIAEGLETTLAVSMATGMPMQCCINAQLLASWQPAKGTKVVFVWEDKDRSQAGSNATKKLIERLKTTDIKIIVCQITDPIPEKEKGIDWLDIFSTYGYEKIPTIAKNWRKYL